MPLLAKNSRKSPGGIEMVHEFINPATLSASERENGADFAPKFASNGLILAVTCEVGSNEVLMVAYMNRQALVLTLETGVVHYYSRSREALWKKGETSGEIQKLVEMRTDCDQDTLLLKVEQTGRGAACHTGHKSCFFRRLETKGGDISLISDKGPALFDPETVYKKPPNS
ncbi:Phosphoribosyl-AMP cyclohydrolase [hydrothermal vent metagenome]|uniref:Histidine biosynthesis bifunctional protein HisIE n=1 Tax=hydrothermal vent metagenome TaxID=652676 RepID=A0A3B0TI46_9ZZZZ